MSQPGQTDVERNAPTDENVKNVHQQVEDVKAIMSENVVRIMQRGERLEDLNARTEALNASSMNFQTTARQVQRKMCFKNLKWTIILSVVSVLVILLIVLLILDGAGVFDHKDSPNPPPPPQPTPTATHT